MRSCASCCYRCVSKSCASCWINRRPQRGTETESSSVQRHFMNGALKQIIPQTPASIGHQKSESLTGVMILLYSSMVWLAVCVDGESLITVSAPVGSTAVLPCKLTKEFTNKSVIRWFVNNQLVLVRSINGMNEGSGFEGRVDVPVAELRKGNCSLVLKDVRISDDDLYKTFSVEHFEETGEIKPILINRVHLSVDALQISAREGSTVLLPCKWSNLPVQTPHVEWSNDRKTVFERRSKESFPGEGYEGRVDVPEDELLKGNCSLVLKNFSVSDAGIYRSSMLVEEKRERVLVQKIKLSVNNSSKEETDLLEHWDLQEPVGNGNSWIIWISVISGIVLIIIIIIIIIIISVFVIYRRRKGILTTPSVSYQATDSTVRDSQLCMEKDQLNGGTPQHQIWTV